MDAKYTLNDDIVKYYEKIQKSNYLLLLILLLSILINGALIAYDQHLGQSLDHIIPLEDNLQDQDVSLYEAKPTVNPKQIKNLSEFAAIEFDSLTLEKDKIVISLRQETRKLEDTISKLESFAKNVKIVSINENQKESIAVLEVIL